MNNKEMLERTKITEKQIERLENEIDQLNVNLSDLESFVLPGGTLASSYLHLARTVIRKAERLMVKMDSLEENSVSETALKYINRLSDLLFLLPPDMLINLILVEQEIFCGDQDNQERINNIIKEDLWKTFKLSY